MVSLRFGEYDRWAKSVNSAVDLQQAGRVPKALGEVLRAQALWGNCQDKASSGGGTRVRSVTSNRSDRLLGDEPSNRARFPVGDL